MNRPLTCLFLCFALVLAKANMASPILEGSWIGSAFSSRDIDILSEKIYIKSDSALYKARFTVEYRVKVGHEGGGKTPLLFQASDYEDGFAVWVDGVNVPLKNIPDEAILNPDSLSGAFKEAIGQDGQAEERSVEVDFGIGGRRRLPLSDLKYFEAPLSAGEHLVKVEYDARFWTDKGDWVQKSTLYYALSPAKNWKSFGSLEVVADAPFKNLRFFTDGNPVPATEDGNARRWAFKTLPGENFHIEINPEVSDIAQALIGFGPEGFMLTSGFLLAVLHFFASYRYRKSFPLKRFSWPAIAGAFLVPFAAMTVYVLSFGWIDDVIGDFAGGRHGYTFLMFLFYPFVVAVYLLLAWLSDRLYAKKLRDNL